jgi:hypothetical protein
MSEAVPFAGGFGIGSLLTGILLWLTWLSSASAVRHRSLKPVAMGLVCRLAVLAGAGLLTILEEPPGAFLTGAVFGLLATRWTFIWSARFGCV